MMNKLRIGTRDSKLALWQAKTVQKLLSDINVDSELVLIKSTGDLNLTKPLHQLGTIGVFTKQLDDALLNGEIDIAVHSMKDVPTNLPIGILALAVLERGESKDVIILKKKHSPKIIGERYSNLKIATGSIRRRAMWAHEFPNHTFTDLRGNIQTRIQKVLDSDVDAAIMAKAAIDRLQLDLSDDFHLIIGQSFTPAPAQGAILITSLNKGLHNLIVRKLNHKLTEDAVKIERLFMKLLECGCTSPIGCYVNIDQNKIVHLESSLYSRDGKKNINLSKSFPLADYKQQVSQIVQYYESEGAREIILQDQENDNHHK